MLDEESKAVQEVAKTTGKGIDLIGAAGGALNDIFGESLRQLGGGVADWARYYRYRNFLFIADKVARLLEARRIDGKPLPIPPRFALPLFDGASLEAEENIQALWAGLITNAADPARAYQVRKVFIEILRGLEPLDAEVVHFLSEPGLDERYGMMTEATLNVDIIASGIGADVEDVKLSLQTLARFGCVIDSWENTLESLDTGYSGFRVNNPKSNFRLSHLGKQLVRATSAT